MSLLDRFKTAAASIRGKLDSTKNLREQCAELQAQVDVLRVSLIESKAREAQAVADLNAAEAAKTEVEAKLDAAVASHIQAEAERDKAIQDLLEAVQLAESLVAPAEAEEQEAEAAAEMPEEAVEHEAEAEAPVETKQPTG